MFKTGFKKISSLRLTSHNRPKFKHASTSQSFDLADGPDVAQDSIKEVVEDTGRASLRVHEERKIKRKDIIFNYRQDTVSLDSVSVSSTSEFSAAGTDEISTMPLGDGDCSGPVDIVGGERRCMVGGDRGLGLSDPLSCSNGIGSVSFEISGTSYQTVDSGITVDSHLGKGSSAAAIGKGSPNRFVGKGSSPAHSLTGNGSLASKTTVNGKQVSVSDAGIIFNSKDTTNFPGDLEATLCDELNLEEGKAEDGGGNGESGTLKSSVNESGLLKHSGLGDVATNAAPTSNGACVDDLSPLGDDGGGIFPGLGEGHVRGIDQAGHDYANIKLLASWSAGMRGAGHSIKGVSRKRSKSNSSNIRRKPKPLPRKSLTKQVLIGDNEERGELFLSSLPSNFKPVALPRRTPPGSNPHTPPHTPPTPKKRRSVKSTASSKELPPNLKCEASDLGSPQNVVSSPQYRKSPSSSPPRLSPARTTPKHTSPDPPRHVSACTTPKHTSPDSSQRVSPARITHTSPVRITQRLTQRRTPPSPPQHKSPTRTSQRRRPPSPPKQSSPVRATLKQKPPTLSPLKHDMSAPNTPVHKAIDDLVLQTVSEPSTPQCQSSTPSSPFYSSNSNFSSDIESSIGGRSTGGEGGVTSDPVPPPRRRRKSSKLNSRESSKDSLLSVDVMPVSPEELPVDQKCLPESRDQPVKQCNGGSPSVTEPKDFLSPKKEICVSVSHDFEDGVNTESRDPGGGRSASHDAKDSASSKSHDPSEEDLPGSPLLDEFSDVFKENGPPTATSLLVGRNSHCSVSSSVRTSRTSLTVFADTSSMSNLSGATLRPYSYIGHPDVDHHFNLSGSYERSGESFTGGHTLPKSVVGITWGGRGKVLPNRQSVKGVLMPASSECIL